MYHYKETPQEIQNLFFQHMKKLSIKASQSFDEQFSDRWVR
jgi:hypothetical protein